MQFRSLFNIGAAALLVFTMACSDEETGPDTEQFTATLAGSAERPNPVTTNATGAATFTVGTGTVDFTITTQNITGATAAHIHGPAGSDAATGVLVTLFSAAAPGINVANGTLSTGTFPSTQFTIKTGVTVDSVLTLLRNGQAYVNVHTVTNPAGEIRGQVQVK
jgi:CHRD domain